MPRWIQACGSGQGNTLAQKVLIYIEPPLRETLNLGEEFETRISLLLPLSDGLWCKYAKHIGTALTHGLRWMTTSTPREPPDPQGGLQAH